MPPPGKVAEVLIVNGVECEPYLTCDHQLMLEKGEEIIIGIQILMRALNIQKAIIGIEANKDEIGGIKAMRELADKFQGEMTRAYEAAQMLWKEYPELKQVTLDTMTDEERDMLEQAENSNNKN